MPVAGSWRGGPGGAGADGFRVCKVRPKVYGVPSAALQDQAKDLLSRPAHPVFDLVDHDRLHRVAHREAPVSSQAERRGLERALDLAQWMDIYRPEVSLG